MDNYHEAEGGAIPNITGHAPEVSIGRASSTAADFLTALFQHATHNIYMCTLANVKDDPRTGSEDRIRTRDGAEITKFVSEWNVPLRATYFCVATIDGTKRNKTTARELPALWADIDFKDTDEKPADILRKVKQLLPLPPSIIVSSGHGYHCYWLFKEPWPATEIDRIEAALKLLADLVAGDVLVTQIAALMRVPGSNNTKVENDWKSVEIVEQNDRTYELDDLEEMLAEKSPIILRKVRPKDQSLGDNPVWNAHVKGLSSRKKPPIDVEKRLASMAYMAGGDAAIHQTQLQVTAALLNKGVPIKEVVAVVLKATQIAAGDYGRNWNMKREERGLQGMCETWIAKHPPDEKTLKPTRAPVPGELDWRERRKNGSPMPSMHNARLAIGALGVECKYDTFHNKLLFGYADDTNRHTIENIVGEISDHGILALRQLMSKRFGFDLTDQFTRDAVTSLALECCFDPVCDMLADAEAKWDKVERLDRMAADYLNCEDTELNAAYTRKTMIAAVARARTPGIKFDQITVLESDEGFNKSSAWLVLAGEENFSDETIIGKNSREVQEQLAEIWIHENADLAGMRKAEVETVKAYASRQVDRARPAYGHFLKKQPRHSIEVGSTNSTEYLQSQTGNRRIWSLRVLKTIDIEKLRGDRLQLFGEAAHYQSSGESLVLDEKYWSHAGEQQEERRVTDPWESALHDIPHFVKIIIREVSKDGFLQPKEKDIPIRRRNDGGEEKVATSDLLEHVLKISPGNQRIDHTMRLSTTMQKLGWQRNKNGYVSIAGNRVKGYFRPLPGTAG